MSYRPESERIMSRTAIDDCWNRIGVNGDASCPELHKHVHCRNCPIYATAATLMLNRDLPDDYRSYWTRHFAQPKKTEEDSEAQSAIIFRVGAERMALPTAVLQEVAELGAIHSLPHWRAGILLGLTNICGELLLCVSLGRLLGIEEVASPKTGKSGSAHRRLFVVCHERLRLTFPVDEVYGVHRHHPRDLQQVPATVNKAAATYTKAILPWQGKSVGYLDDGLILHALNRSLL
jgi:chemotaxis-related protein WspD